MRSILTVLVTLSTLMAIAQPPAGMTRGRSGQGMNMGRFYGKVVDAQTNRPLEAASVQLVQNRFDSVSKKRADVVIAGQLTAGNGDFSLENLPVMGQFKLRITAIGYKQIEQAVKFDIKPGGNMQDMMSKVDRDLGNIKLEVDAQQLQEVKITATKPFMQMGVDRRIFNVEKSLVSQGQTATELMRNIPGLDVDIDGNVTMRNASPTIFVDGRPTTLTLDQIPADAIASVEMITNPSAKFDASGGMAGILNIVLKKNRRVGYNGNIRAGIDSRAKTNIGGDINVKQDKINFFLSGMRNERKSIGIGQSFRRETYTSPNVVFNQTNEPVSDGAFMFLRGGFDYFLDNRNTFTLSANIVRGNRDGNDLFNIQTDSIYQSETRSDFSTRSVNNSFFFRNNNFALGYKRLFQKSGMELTSDLNYSRGSNGSEVYQKTQFYDENENPKGIPLNQSANGTGKNNNFTFQTDYVNPLGENGKMEMGVRAAIRNVRNQNLNYLQDPVSGELIPIAAVNANFKYTEKVYAAYSTYSNKVGKNFTYMLGLRVESSEYEGTLLTRDSSFSNSFPFSVFPSVFLTYKLPNEDDMQFSYSRRINRPNFFQLIPFIDFTDSLNIRRGNPNLIPEFTQSLELSYQRNFGKGHSLLLSGWFKYTDDLITNFQVREPSSTTAGRDVIINTYINANSSRAYGFEITSRNPATKWLDLTTNLNFFNSKINTDNISAIAADDRFSFFGKLNAAFKLPKNYSIQLSGDYRSKTILPQGGGGGRGGWGGFVQTTAQGYQKSNGAVDIAIRKEFMKERRASISVSMNDIFRTRRFGNYSQAEFFIQDFERRQDWRVVRLNFNYRFGKFDASIFKRRNNRGGDEGMQEGMQMQQ